MRNCSAVCSPIAVSIASFMLLKLGARLRAGLSDWLTKLGSFSVKSISSLNCLFWIIVRIVSVVAGGIKTDSRLRMNPWRMSVRPTIERLRISPIRP